MKKARGRREFAGLLIALKLQRAASVGLPPTDWVAPTP
jgi:hypothetical protein